MAVLRAEAAERADTASRLSPFKNLYGVTRIHAATLGTRAVSTMNSK